LLLKTKLVLTKIVLINDSHKYLYGILFYHRWETLIVFNYLNLREWLRMKVGKTPVKSNKYVAICWPKCRSSFLICLVKIRKISRLCLMLCCGEGWSFTVVFTVNEKGACKHVITLTLKLVRKWGAYVRKWGKRESYHGDDANSPLYRRVRA